MKRALLVFLLVVCPAIALAGQPRFALLVGSNEGSPRRARLWFAENDAERLARTLAELGDFAPDNVKVLKGPTAGELKVELMKLAHQAMASLERGEVPLVLFFYSGHADPQGLELGH